jgi:hypothetical protein
MSTEEFHASTDGVRRNAMGYEMNSVNIHTRHDDRTYIAGAITDKNRHLLRSSTSATASNG